MIDFSNLSLGGGIALGLGAIAVAIVGIVIFSTVVSYAAWRHDN